MNMYEQVETHWKKNFKSTVAILRFQEVIIKVLYDLKFVYTSTIYYYFPVFSL